MPYLTDHFQEKEFECSCKCKAGSISLDLVKKLEKVRVKYNKGIRINSGIRCIVFNRSIGSKETSSHVPRNGKPSLAADLHCDTMMMRKELLPLLLDEFDRIGIHKQFIHVDIDMNKPLGVFVY